LSNFIKKKFVKNHSPVIKHKTYIAAAAWRYCYSNNNGTRGLKQVHTFTQTHRNENNRAQKK